LNEQPRCRSQADYYADEREPHALPQNEPQHVGSLRAEDQSDD